MRVPAKWTIYESSQSVFSLGNLLLERRTALSQARA